MFVLYNIIVYLAQILLIPISFFVPKIKLFRKGRMETFRILKNNIPTNSPVIWIHAASLGEYEQGLPIIEPLRSCYPDHKIVISFFSPSGYEVRKNNTHADATVYLPLDTPTLVNKWMETLNIKMALFVKYEYWPNYLKALKKREIPTYLISGIFRENQIFFKPYGGFYRNCLSTFDHFFLQNDESVTLLASLGYQNTTKSGDTRFDRVAKIAYQDNTLDFVKEFKGNDPLIVFGSTWPHDEMILSQYVNQNKSGVKFLIAPHNIKEEQLKQLEAQLSVSHIRYSNMTQSQLADRKVLIVDTIGLLTKIYAYADIAYVGGGFGNPGVHNTLEPATFGCPVVIGPNYQRFQEAIDLIEHNGAISIRNQEQFNQKIDLLIENTNFRLETGRKAKEFIQTNIGATPLIINHLSKL